MVRFSLLRFLLPFTWAAVGLQSSAHVVMFAVLGDSITLPCAIPSVRYCSSVTWTMAGEFHSVTEVVTAGRATSTRHDLLNDCSLRINHLALDDARLYVCDSGALDSSVSLQILNITENPAPAKGMIELQCHLDMFKGHVPCNHTGIQLKWTAEDDTPVHGDRFHFENPSACLSKLVIKKKVTDHHRIWKCQLTQNEVVKASVTYTTTQPDGVEEVFAAAGESASLSCSHISSVGVSVLWAGGGKWITDNISHGKGQPGTFHVSQDSSLVISNVSALHVGDYQCSEASEQKKVLNKIRLHVLDVTSEYGPGEDDLTLMCVLICANECDTDFKLTWSGRSQNSWQTGSMKINNTLINKLFLSVRSLGSDTKTCSVRREDVVMASGKWRYINSLQTLAWLVLPLGLLIAIAAGGLYMYTKRKRNQDAAGNGQLSFRMSHVYEDVHDVNNEELQQRRPCNREAAAADGFYHLLQAANQD